MVTIRDVTIGDEKFKYPSTTYFTDHAFAPLPLLRKSFPEIITRARDIFIFETTVFGYMSTDNYYIIFGKGEHQYKRCLIVDLTSVCGLSGYYFFIVITSSSKCFHTISTRKGIVELMQKYYPDEGAQDDLVF